MYTHITIFVWQEENLSNITNNYEQRLLYVVFFLPQ